MVLQLCVSWAHISVFSLADVINQVAVFIGEIIGRYANEWFMNMGIRKNKGVFEAEIRLW